MSTLIQRNYIYRYLGDDPKYTSFLKAQGIDPVKAKKNNPYTKLLERNDSRLRSYEQMWKYFLNAHWLQTTEAGIDPVKVNYCRKVVEKNAQWLMGKGFLIESDFPKIEKFLQKQWAMNGATIEANAFGLDAAIHGGITGDVFFEIFYDVKDGENYIRVKRNDSSESFPVLFDNTMKGFLSYGAKEYPIDLSDPFTDYKIINSGRYYSKGFITELKEEEVYAVQELDLLDLPVVHIPNFSVGKFYGISDIVPVYELNNVIDKLVTQIEEIVEYHGSPVTILEGADPSDLVQGANKLWGIPKGAKIYNLELKGELGAIVTQLQNVSKYISEQGNLPLYSLGGENIGISNTSGSALNVLFMPLYETLNYKRVLYGKGILEINKIMIKLGILSGELKPGEIIKEAINKWNKIFVDANEDIKAENYPFAVKVNEKAYAEYDKLSSMFNDTLPSELFTSYITWYPPMERDEKIMADLAVSLVNNKLWSIRHGRSVIGMSEKESILMNREIVQENKLLGAMKITNAVPKKTGLEGSPDVKGEKESIRRQTEV